MKHSAQFRLKKIIKKRPLVIGTLLGTESLTKQMAVVKKTPIDLLEIRLDTFEGIHDEGPNAIVYSHSLLSQIRHQTKKPLLLTLRTHKEMGKRVPKRDWLNDGQRAEIVRHLFHLIDFVDIEIDQKIYAREMSVMARKARVGIIHSFHNFHHLYHWTKIKKLSQQSKRLGGDIFKVAVKVNSKEETYKFLERGMALKFPAKILITMGSQGLLSRIGGYSFGSIATFGHLGKPAAPGQLDVGSLVKTIHAAYGGT